LLVVSDAWGRGSGGWGLAPPDHVRPSHVGERARHVGVVRPAGLRRVTWPTHSRGQRKRRWVTKRGFLEFLFSGPSVPLLVRRAAWLWLARRSPDPVAPTNKTDKLHSRKLDPSTVDIYRTVRRKWKQFAGRSKAETRCGRHVVLALPVAVKGHGNDQCGVAAVTCGQHEPCVHLSLAFFFFRLRRATPSEPHPRLAGGDRWLVAPCRAACGGIRLGWLVGSPIFPPLSPSGVPRTSSGGWEWDGAALNGGRRRVCGAPDRSG
jgi:hypothetical protein